MGGCVEAHETRSKDELFTVLGHDEIWPLISKEEPDKDLLPMRSCDLYIVLTVDNYIIGCAYFEILGEKELQMHPYILPEFRKQYAYTGVRKAIDWAFSIKTDRITVEIPSIYPRVLRFARRMGFHDVSCNRKDSKDNMSIFVLEMRPEQWAVL